MDRLDRQKKSFPQINIKIFGVLFSIQTIFYDNTMLSLEY